MNRYYMFLGSFYRISNDDKDSGIVLLRDRRCEYFKEDQDGEFVGTFGCIYTFDLFLMSSYTLIQDYFHDTKVILLRACPLLKIVHFTKS